MNQDDMKHTLTHGITGLLVGAVGTATSLLPQIEQWLRILVLLLSVAATGLSVWKLWRGRNGNDTQGKVMLPFWVMLLAIVICVAITGGCSQPAPAVPQSAPPREMIVGMTTVRGSDGQLYRLVKRGRDAGPGSVSEVDLWQPMGSAGPGLPAYSRRLQSASDTSDPIFTKAGVLE